MSRRQIYLDKLSVARFRSSFFFRFKKPILHLDLIPDFCLEIECDIVIYSWVSMDIDSAICRSKIIRSIKYDLFLTRYNLETNQFLFVPIKSPPFFHLNPINHYVQLFPILR